MNACIAYLIWRIEITKSFLMNCSNSTDDAVKCNKSWLSDTFVFIFRFRTRKTTKMLNMDVEERSFNSNWLKYIHFMLLVQINRLILLWKGINYPNPVTKRDLAPVKLIKHINQIEFSWFFFFFSYSNIQLRYIQMEFLKWNKF